MLSASTTARLREAIARRSVDPAAPDGELRDALRAAATEARDRALRAEELVIALKTLLAEVADEHPSWSATEQLRLRESIVTASIRAFYGRGD